MNILILNCNESFVRRINKLPYIKYKEGFFKNIYLTENGVGVNVFRLECENFDNFDVDVFLFEFANILIGTECVRDANEYLISCKL